MKILLSGYACSPYRGSEAGVGWTAACRIARDHDVLVMTGSRNRNDLERAAQEGIIPKNMRFHYLEEATGFHPNRTLARMQNWLRYRAFNQQSLPEANHLHRSERFDLCHQVTIASWRLPSPLWQLPIPFIWGPIGGAGRIPHKFRSILTSGSRLFERTRDLSSLLAANSAKFRRCLENTAVILAANQETADHLSPFRGGLPLIKLPIVSLGTEKIERFRTKSRQPGNGPLRCFAGGNMIGSKGLALALKALKTASDRGVDFHYTIAGYGPEIPAMKCLVIDLGISNQVLFHDGYSGQDYIDALQASDVYLLPSFREGTPVTMLEACLAGCYPVVADISAQGEIAHLCGGHAAPVNSIEDLIEGLADAIVWCSEHRDQLPQLATAISTKIADHFSSERYDATLEEAYRIALGA